MRYIPNTSDDVRHMLETIGVASVDALFDQIPEAHRLQRNLDLPDALSESDLVRHMSALAGKNRDLRDRLSFLGAGVYHHHAPAAVDELLSRSEFYTAYTPYQPEVSQGTLQAVFEFQTLITQLLGMEVANASMYDGSTSVAEATLMARRATRRSRVVVSQAVHPEYREVTDAYLRATPDDVVTVPFDEDGRTSLSALRAAVDDDTAAVLVQSPNFFGGLEHLTEIAEIAHAHKALLIVAFTEALAFGLVRPPGAYGADIVAGEGQSLGVSMALGGPHLGLFATTKKRMRAMPGRLVGQTVDAQGREGYVLTLATREQHIRRERATSNICTNEGLCALAATIYLALLGPVGLRKLAHLNHVNAERAKSRLASLDGYALRFPTLPTFHEFVLRTPRPASEIVDALADKGVVPGLALGGLHEGLDDSLLVNVTELHTFKDIDHLAEQLATVS